MLHFSLAERNTVLLLLGMVGRRATLEFVGV
jgi:hypothetical protein